MIAELLATFATALFAGAAVYINVVEHPARMSLGAAAALAEWAPSYQRATTMQASLAIVGALAAIVAWATGGGVEWLIGGLIILAVVPFTLLVILPTNKQLLDPAASRDLDRTALLLARWNRLHAVRTLLSVVALALFLLSLSAMLPYPPSRGVV
jgi:uncharacterized membrane protein